MRGACCPVPSPWPAGRADGVGAHAARSTSETSGTMRNKRRAIDHLRAWVFEWRWLENYGFLSLLVSGPSSGVNDRRETRPSSGEACSIQRAAPDHSPPPPPPP